MLLSLRKNSQTSLFKEVRVFKDSTGTDSPKLQLRRFLDPDPKGPCLTKNTTPYFIKYAVNLLSHSDLLWRPPLR